jgi:uncharacterized membrane protein
MTKLEFLKELKKNLEHLPQNEIDDILRDQEEFFYNAIQAGRTEEQAAASLGDPKTFALNLSLVSKIQAAKESPSVKTQLKITWDAVLAVLALAPLNLIFVLGPFLLVAVLTLSGWIVAASLFVAAVVVFLSFLVKSLFVNAGIWAVLSALCLSAGSIGICLLAIIAMVFITRVLLLGSMAYLRWNINFIKGRA